MIVEVPTTWAEAAPRLCWVVRRRFTPVNLIRASCLGPAFTGVVGPSVGWLDVRLVLDGERMLTYVQRRHLVMWGVDARTALETARRDLEAAVGLFGPWEGFAAAPSTGELLVGERLEDVLSEARHRYGEALEPLSPLVFTRVRGEVVPVSSRDVNPVRIAELLALARVYDDQAEVLDADEGTVIAGLAVQWRGGAAVSVCRWEPSVPTLLPRADLVSVGGELVPFDALPLERVPGLDPPRFRSVRAPITP